MSLTATAQQPSGSSRPVDTTGTPSDTQAYARSIYSGLLAGSDAEYQAAFREFIPVGVSRDNLPAPTVEKIETGWADLMRAEAELNGALALNPDDPFLNNRMLELRSRQLSFLKQLAALDRNNRRLTI